LLLVGCSSSLSPDSSATRTGGVHGIQIRLSPSELSFVSDAVVVATAGPQDVQSFSSNKLIPKSAHGQEGYAEGSFVSTQIRVTELLKGGLATNPSVASLHSLSATGRDAAISGEAADENALKPGLDYVLFLTKGTELWAGHYLTLGPQGVGVIQDDVVHFATGKTIDLSLLIRQVQSPSAPSGGE
jgi:hypothetical protein